MRDFRYAVRSLWRHKSFAAAAVLTLAIGLRANTALFGLVNAALRPLAVPGADQLVTIAAETKDDQSGGFQYAFSLDALKDLQERATSFTDVFAVSPRVGGLSADGKPLQLPQQLRAPVHTARRRCDRLARTAGQGHTTRIVQDPCAEGLRRRMNH